MQFVKGFDVTLQMGKVMYSLCAPVGVLMWIERVVTALVAESTTNHDAGLVHTCLCTDRVTIIVFNNVLFRYFGHAHDVRTLHAADTE